MRCCRRETRTFVSTMTKPMPMPNTPRYRRTMVVTSVFLLKRTPTSENTQDKKIPSFSGRNILLILTLPIHFIHHSLPCTKRRRVTVLRPPPSWLGMRIQVVVRGRGKRKLPDQDSKKMPLHNALDAEIKLQSRGKEASGETEPRYFSLFHTKNTPDGLREGKGGGTHNKCCPTGAGSHRSGHNR